MLLSPSKATETLSVTGARTATKPICGNPELSPRKTSSQNLLSIFSLALSQQGKPNEPEGNEAERKDRTKELTRPPSYRTRRRGFRQPNAEGQRHAFCLHILRHFSSFCLFRKSMPMDNRSWVYVDHTLHRVGKLREALLTGGF